MTKDQVIDYLRQQNEWLRMQVDFQRERAEFLEAQRETQQLLRTAPLSSTERSRRYRERKRDESGTASVPELSTNGTGMGREWDEMGRNGTASVPGGTIGGSTSVLLEGATEYVPEDQETVDPEHTQLEEGAGGNHGTKVGRPASPDDPTWDSFREVYPKLTHRTNWTTTRRRWDKIHLAERGAVVLGATNYAPSRDVLRGCEMAAQRFLNERTWEQWQEAETPLPIGGGWQPKEPAGFAGLREWSRLHAANADIIDGERTA